MTPPPRTPLRALALTSTLGLAALALGAGAGAWGAAWITGRGERLNQIEKDGWTGSLSVGSPHADPWTRAVTAQVGLMALDRREAVYFHRYRDETGRPLDERCAYEISGGDLPARWWSITLYAADEFLARNDDGAPSIDATGVSRDADGRWRARAAPTRQGAADWLSSRDAGAFSLAIRLYNPEDAAVADVRNIAFPAVRRIGCEGEDA